MHASLINRLQGSPDRNLSPSAGGGQSVVRSNVTKPPRPTRTEAPLHVDGNNGLELPPLPAMLVDDLLELVARHLAPDHALTGLRHGRSEEVTGPKNGTSGRLLSCRGVPRRSADMMSRRGCPAGDWQEQGPQPTPYCGHARSDPGLLATYPELRVE